VTVQQKHPEAQAPPAQLYLHHVHLHVAHHVGRGPPPHGHTCSMSICTRPTMLTTLLSRRPICLDWNEESLMFERRPATRPSKGKVCTWGGRGRDSSGKAVVADRLAPS
jgi:hypothetical protein